MTPDGDTSWHACEWPSLTNALLQVAKGLGLSYLTYYSNIYDNSENNMAEKSRASLIGCRRGLEVVRDGLVEVHRNLQEEVPDAQVAAEEARRLEPGKESGQLCRLFVFIV